MYPVRRIGIGLHQGMDLAIAFGHTIKAGAHQIERCQFAAGQQPGCLPGVGFKQFGGVHKPDNTVR